MIMRILAGLMILCSISFAQIITAAPGYEFPSYDSIAKVGETVELLVEAKDGIKYEWSHDGNGKLEIVQDTIKAKWTAPTSPSKTNPALITIIARDNSGTVTRTFIKKVAVFGGEILDQPLLFFCDGPGSARLFKCAPNQVKETRYQWEVMRGTESVFAIPEDTSKSEAKFKTRKVSQKKDDVEIKLTYILESEKEKKTFEISRRTYVKMPLVFKQISRDNKIEEGPDIYGYNTFTTYQILDQFNEPLSAEGIIINQEITLVSNPYAVLPKSIKVDLKQYVTDWEGKVVSRRFITTVAPLPDKFEALYEQDLYVNDSCLLEKLDIVYSKNGVEEKVNRDRKTRRQKMEEVKKKPQDKKEGSAR
ncbi:MAG: hypothetical protein A2452_00320 [Candidatus Firestonebacteria bacterium RIFOXYC2_FULL_39_67]|nr:MAG: hypothetical protein A2536_03400 [Candidatus Firestonebacteria bacterium RIFOXYD2_FULL_39_29]OGF53738.1 MAG: hypothetical protein A2497_02770 [Candidatus Firestonebacteria bacterium RifOxyC12_full_39_7]OGF54978.1 MAG: hypothetical protein A2452_00320 [Candidatus Firestonebacteria bacterium RIFOXYC2_FULL_39_67]